jgi:DNA mismatch endonuclease, patch repair protein
MNRPVPSSDAAARRFRAQRRLDTAPELALRKALYARGVRYRLQQRLIPGLRRTVDLAFPKVKVAVEVRGCFWHCCPEHGTLPRANAEWWRAKLLHNVARDRETEQLLIADGWFVVTVWEHEKVEDAVDKVLLAISQRQRPTEADPSR